MGYQMAINVTSKKTGEVASIDDIAKGSSELAQVLKQIRKSSPTSVGLASQILDLERIPTGVFEFDYHTGGGFPCGRYSVVFGKESSGKTNLIFNAIKSVQLLPPPCNVAVFVDVEGTFDPTWAAQFGIDLDKLLVIKPTHGEEAVDIIQALVKVEEVKFIGVDSVAAMISVNEDNKSVSTADVGSQSLLVKRLCNKVVLALNNEAKRNHFPCLVFINQIRYKIGVMFGNPETMPCGETIKFLSSLTVRIDGKDKMIKEYSSELPVFKEVNARIVKSKIPVMGKTFGYDHTLLAHDLLTVGQSASFSTVEKHLKTHGVLKKSGTGKGWVLDGLHQNLLSDFQQKYYAEPEYALKLQKLVLNLSAKEGFIIDSENTADVEDNL